MDMRMSETHDLILPLESAEFVMQHAKSVQINPEGVDNLANKVDFLFKTITFFLYKYRFM